jgi:RNA polymerase sigma-70 factor (ECF subfamily)
LSGTSTDIHQSVINLAREGNPQALHQLYELYSTAMFNICCRILNNTADAEDMLQEVFIEAFGKLDSFRFESTFGAWLKRITINKCINELKKKKAPIEYNETLPNSADQSYSDDLSEDMNLTVERIKHAMALLPDGYRIVFSLYMMEGYDHEEIASILNISESTSKTQLMRARKKIVDILKMGQINVTSKN